MGDRTQAWLATTGMAGEVGGTKAQYFLAGAALLTVFEPQGAPICTHCVKTATSASFILGPGGILRAPAVWRTTFNNRLLAGSPGMSDAPRLPPLIASARSSSRRAPMMG